MPTNNKATADKFYKDQYEHPVNIDLEKLDWFPSVEPPTVPYNLSAYTPKNIRAVLSQKDKNSSPGYDEIVYEYLLNMPFFHQALATAFTKNRDKGVAPDSWAKSKVILIKKDPDATDDEPTNFRMISLTLNIGKLYHTLEAGRTLQYMLKNKYLDPMAQKAYVNGINGCMEHVIVVQEIIQHAKLNGKTLHATWFDLRDAFGSVSHQLIPYVMDHYHIPKQIITYIVSLYSKLEGKVFTKDWESEFFKFLKGVFQGDPYSGIIFLIVFNPLIEYIKQHAQTHGYPLTTQNKGVKNVVTTPFADDFNLITHNKNMHQKLVTDIAEKIKSMGLQLKPQKCRSLLIEKGKIVNINFTIEDENRTDINIDSVIDKPMKFLGSNLAGDNSPSAMFVKIYSMLEAKLKNIDKSMLRGEFKLNIYSRYALPSVRYFLSVHQIHETHMQKLDMLVKKFVKLWLKIQKNGVSDAAIFHPYMLCTKMPSQLYKEAHAGNLAIIRSKGDSIVNHALDSRLEREASWTRKYSTVNHMQTLWQENIKENRITLPHAEEAYTATSLIVRQAKGAMLKSIKEETLKYWNERVRKLTFQGDFIQLLIEEKENITWKSVINNIPRGILSFAMKSSVNGLNTPDNLKRWGIRQTNKCDQCGNFGDLEHTLNWCKTALDQGRFTWRHNSILSHLAKELNQANIGGSWTIYADLPGLNLNGGTIPPTFWSHRKDQT